MYEILPYTKEQAKRLGVKVELSHKSKYKIDVFTKEGEYINSVGATGYSDYPHYIQDKGQEYADRRRIAYKIRHQKDRVKIGSRGWLADNLLW